MTERVIGGPGGVSPERMQAALLAWYDRMARRLPWRVPPGSGRTPDPYRVWLSEVMLQQTTVAAVAPRFGAFVARWPDVRALAAAEDGAVMAAWAGLGYYARARNMLACARAVVAEHGGQFPSEEAALRELPGIGRYTAAAIAAIAFDRPAVVMDGNIERVMARLFAETQPLPGVKPVLHAHAARLTPRHRPGDHAQALMDLGAMVCTPRRPVCGLCPLRSDCAAHAAGLADALPARAPKPVKPLRHGIAWLARLETGAILLERRPPHGLLGGMLGLPGTPWTETPPDPAPPFAAPWRDAGVAISHVFTHFRLRLVVHAATVATVPPGLLAHPADRLEVLPTVMRKAVRAGLAALGPMT